VQLTILGLSTFSIFYFFKTAYIIKLTNQSIRHALLRKGEKRRNIIQKPNQNKAQQGTKVKTNKKNSYTPTPKTK
jgi:hypothetical protein